jgi:lipoprotein-anchoring transpeptidase ErfK/SrfK
MRDNRRMQRPQVAVAALIAAAAAAVPAAADAAVVRGPTRSEAWVAQIVVPARAYARPDGGAVVAWLRTHARWAGGPNQLLVLATRRDRSERLWLRVRLPSRPNDADGWIRADHAVTTRTGWRVRLDVGRRRVTVRRDGRVVRRFGAVVGAPGTPTPRGLFAVSEMVRQPDAGGFLGPWALHLTAHSDVLDNYGGGDGRVAIHGRAGLSLADPLGSARSHGCIRVDNREIRFLARVLVPGAPVRVVA